MKTIYKIARAELSLLFYSPIAWFLLVVFFFQCGMAFTGKLEVFLMDQHLGSALSSLTSRIYGMPVGILPDMAGKLYLYLPLLTMGLMSREINGGTIKLLYSSPIRVREIIFGKYLAMLLYNLVLTGILLLAAGCGVVVIQHAETGMLLSGLFGVYLLLCAYSAIGLFMSCLTSYQVVAALSTLVLLGILNYIGSLWQGIDFVRDLTYFLSINGRAGHMMQGLITTKDVLYFLVIVFIFLSFSIYRLQSDRESKPWMVKAARYAGIMAGALALGYISSRPGLIGYWDTTATKEKTLTNNSRKIVKELGDEPVEVTSYINLLDERFYYGIPEERNNDMARWEPYLRFKSNFSFKYVYFYDSTANKNMFKYNPGVTLDSMAKKYAWSMKRDLNKFRTPAEMHSLIDLRQEENRYVMQLKYKDRTTFLRLYNDPYVFPSETETDAALSRLMKAKLPKIAFVYGELERRIDNIGERHYKGLTNTISFRNSLINQGFDVESVSLKDQDIPADLSALVIADPKIELDTAAVAKLQRYITAGGNLLIAGEPGRQAILNPLLRPLGVQLMDGMLVQRSKDFAPDLIRPYLAPAAAGLTKVLAQRVKDSMVVSMNGAAALTYNTDGPFTIQPFVMTPAVLSWNKKIRLDQEQMDELADAQASGDGPVAAAAGRRNGAGSVKEQKIDSLQQGLVFSPEQGDQRGPLPVMLGLTRTINGKQQRIVVAGDADFLSNAELSRQNIRTCNFDLSTALFSWFSNGEFPIETYRPPSPDNRLLLNDTGLSFLKIVMLGVLPGLLLIMGSILLIRRKRK